MNYVKKKTTKRMPHFHVHNFPLPQPNLSSRSARIIFKKNKFHFKKNLQSAAGAVLQVKKTRNKAFSRLWKRGVAGNNNDKKKSDLH